ncbi:hypothetical protein R0G64_32940, partial [Pseudomonas otitidis]
NPPAGLLTACAELGRSDFARCVVFHSLSKRSNLPGLLAHPSLDERSDSRGPGAWRQARMSRFVTLARL